MGANCSQSGGDGNQNHKQINLVFPEESENNHDISEIAKDIMQDGGSRRHKRHTGGDKLDDKYNDSDSFISSELINKVLNGGNNTILDEFDDYDSLIDEITVSIEDDENELKHIKEEPIEKKILKRKIHHEKKQKKQKHNAETSSISVGGYNFSESSSIIESPTSLTSISSLGGSLVSNDKASGTRQI